MFLIHNYVVIIRYNFYIDKLEVIYGIYRCEDDCKELHT